MQDFSSPQGKPFDFPEGNHGVLLIHGFTGSPGHMRPLGEKLREAGFAVRGILLPGHGESPEALSLSYEIVTNSQRSLTLRLLKNKTLYRMKRAEN